MHSLCMVMESAFNALTALTRSPVFLMQLKVNQSTTGMVTMAFPQYNSLKNMQKYIKNVVKNHNP